MKDSSISRREFLKIAGVAGAGIGVAGGLVAACGGSTTTTTAAPATSTTAAAAETTTTAAAGGETTTSASASVETGREVKLGWVTMTTGIYASLSEPDDFLLAEAKKAIGDGIVCADGKKHPVSFSVKDSQSDTNRSAEVAGQLISNEKPDAIFAGMTPVVNIPVGQQCETNGVPCVTYGCPMEPWYVGMGGDPSKPSTFKWAYNVFWGVSTDLNPVYLGVFNKVSTNKKVALLYANDSDGTATADEKTGFPSVLKPAGYTWINPGLVTGGTEDFSSAINKFKGEGCECLSALLNPPDFDNFWQQAKQASWVPKVTTIGRAILTRPNMDAVGDIGNGLCCETWWENTHPFKSSLMGYTCQGIVDAWNQAKGTPFSPALGLTGGAGFDVIADVVKRTTNVDDPASWAAAIAATNLQTLVGPVQFGAKPAWPNCAIPPLVGGQWIGKKGDWVRKVVDNSHYPSIPATGTIVDLTTIK